MLCGYGLFCVAMVGENVSSEFYESLYYTHGNFGVCLWVCAGVCMYVCMCVCLCVYMCV